MAGNQAGSKPNRCAKFRDKVYENDSFATEYKFMLPDGKEKMSTGKGCCLTVFLLFALIFYGSMQSIKLFTFDETDVMVSQRDSYFDASVVHSEGLWYAFGITAYDSNDQPIEDPTYGVLKPYYKSWGIKTSSTGEDISDHSVYFEELPTRQCTKAELHIHNETDANSKFFKAHKNSESDLSFYY